MVSETFYKEPGDGQINSFARKVHRAGAKAHLIVSSYTGEFGVQRPSTDKSVVFIVDDTIPVDPTVLHCIYRDIDRVSKKGDHTVVFKLKGI